MIKDTMLLMDDYKKVVHNWLEGESDSAYIREFFDIDTISSDIPLANNHAAVMADQYIEFVTSEVFCKDGSWIGFNTKDKSAQARKASVKLMDYLSQKLAESNFYSEAGKLVKEGVLYNRGVIDTYFNNGIQFKTFRNTEISCSKDSDEANKRVYITKYVSLIDLQSAFQGEAIDMLQPKMEGTDLTKEYKLVTAILPINDVFFNMKNMNTEYKYKKVYFLCGIGNGEATMIERKDGNEEGYTVFPLMTYTPHTKASLARSALPIAAKLNEYEQLIGENARKINRPSIAMPESVLTHDNFDLGEEGIVPLQRGDLVPTPIQSAQQMNLGTPELERLERKIDKIFKAELIMRVNITNVSQYEAAGNYLNALAAIQPSAADLITRIPITLLARVHALLIDKDKEYKKLAKAANGKPAMSGINFKMQKLRKASGIGRFIQGVAPAVQMDPSTIQRLDTDKLAVELAASLDCADLVRTDEEVAAEQEAMLEQQESQQAQEQQVADAETAAKQAQAEAALSKQ